MDAASRAQFIEKGYFVVRDALGPDHLRALNEEYSQRVEAEVPAAAPDGGPLLWAGFGKPDWPRRLWSKAYYDLVDPPAIAPLLADLFSDPQCEHTGVAHGSDSAPGSRHYRLDHDNIHFHPGFDPTLDISYEGRQLPKEYWSPGGIVRGGIHGGEAGPQGVAMVTCVYELLPVPEGCGGTTTVRLAPGDCLIFSERLLHATVPYTGSGQRRTLFYKYMPRGAKRADVSDRRFYDMTVDGLTDAQKMILGWPDEWSRHGLVEAEEEDSAAGDVNVRDGSSGTSTGNAQGITTGSASSKL